MTCDDLKDQYQADKGTHDDHHPVVINSPTRPDSKLIGVYDDSHTHLSTLTIPDDGDLQCHPSHDQPTDVHVEIPISPDDNKCPVVPDKTVDEPCDDACIMTNPDADIAQPPKPVDDVLVPNANQPSSRS